jgi:stearoyl-CoA desaturase (delta-9 desaturase)
VWALTKGLGYAHVGWLFDVEQTNQAKYAPDLLRDRDIVRVSHAFPWLVAFSLLAPAILGGLLTWSWQGAVTAFFWAGLVRVGLLHHVTWSINSLCHVYGAKPFVTRDRSGNVTWLAIPSFGESWHNLHHADPTAARHGVLPGQIDPSAALIRGFEKAGWAYDVRWPTPERLAARRVA